MKPTLHYCSILLLVDRLRAVTISRITKSRDTKEAAKQSIYISLSSATKSRYSRCDETTFYHVSDGIRKQMSLRYGIDWEF